MKRLISTILASLWLAITLHSQQNLQEELSNRDNFSIGLNLGASQSGTDTHSWGRHGESITDEAHIMYGLNINYIISPRLSLRANWFSTKISGDDLNLEGPCSNLEDNDVSGPCHKNRGWSFESPLNELGLDLEWHLFKRNYGGKKFNNHDFELDKGASLFKKSISPYITAGIAVTFTNPEIQFSEEAPPSNLKRQKDIDDFSSPFLQFPLGIGVKIDLSQSLSLDLEARGVFPQTDLLDGMSAVTNYQDERNNGDSYQFLHLRINYHL